MQFVVVGRQMIAESHELGKLIQVSSSRLLTQPPNRTLDQPVRQLGYVAGVGTGACNLVSQRRVHEAGPDVGREILALVGLESLALVEVFWVLLVMSGAAVIRAAVIRAAVIRNILNHRLGVTKK